MSTCRGSSCLIFYFSFWSLKIILVEMFGDVLVADEEIGKSTNEAPEDEYQTGGVCSSSNGGKRGSNPGEVEAFTGGRKTGDLKAATGENGADNKTANGVMDVKDTTIKMDKKNKFTAGAPCFAKVKGYCAYPAKVLERSKNVKKEKYSVKFYGTDENAVLDPSSMWPVTEETIGRFVTPGTLKRWRFKPGYEEMMRSHGLLVGDSEKDCGVNKEKDEEEEKVNSDDEYSFDVAAHAVSYNKSSFFKALVKDIDEDIDSESDDDINFGIGKKTGPLRKLTMETEAGENLENKQEEEYVGPVKESAAEKSTASDAEEDLVTVVVGEELNEPVDPTFHEKSMILETVGRKGRKNTESSKKAKKSSKQKKAITKKRGKTLKEDEADLNRIFAEKININEDGSFSCKDCPDFATVFRLLARTHAKTCGTVKKKVGRKVKNRPCTVCGIVCEGKKGLARHFQENHGTVKYTCSTCFRKFEKRKYYLGHLKIHEEQNKIRCPYCPKTFLFKSYLKRHLKRTHTPAVTVAEGQSGQEVDAEDRQEGVQSGDNILSQYQLVIGDAADAANYIVDADSTLILDGVFVTGNIEITVETETGGSSSTGDLEIMNQAEDVIEETDNGNDPIEEGGEVLAVEDKKALLSCQHCGEKGFRNVWFLNRHIKRMHDVPITCEICQCVFIDKYWYIKHSSSCHFICPHPQCNFFTKRKGRLDSHLKKHNVL